MKRTKHETWAKGKLKYSRCVSRKQEVIDESDISKMKELGVDEVEEEGTYLPFHF
jgi:hypothetical protein